MAKVKPIPLGPHTQGVAGRIARALEGKTGMKFEVICTPDKDSSKAGIVHVEVRPGVPPASQQEFTELLLYVMSCRLEAAMDALHILTQIP